VGVAADGSLLRAAQLVLAADHLRQAGHRAVRSRQPKVTGSNPVGRADDQGDRVVVTGRFRGRAKSGAELDASFEHVYEMKDGRIARLENKVDQEAWTTAWS
jgi:ketosteroid isomerase-like protein